MFVSFCDNYKIHLTNDPNQIIYFSTALCMLHPLDIEYECHGQSCQVVYSVCLFSTQPPVLGNGISRKVSVISVRYD